MGADEVALSVAETNKLRTSLGLPPLREGPPPQVAVKRGGGGGGSAATGQAPAAAPAGDDLAARVAA